MFQIKVGRLGSQTRLETYKSFLRGCLLACLLAKLDSESE